MKTSKLLRHISGRQLITQLRFLCALFLLSLSPLVLAQESVALLKFSSSTEQQSTPTYGDSAQKISISAQAIILADSEAFVTVEVSSDVSVQLDIKERTAYLNGDRMIRAFSMVAGQFYSLSLMVGQQDLYGHLSTPEGNFQITAIAIGESFEGWLYKPRGLFDEINALNNDFIIRENDSSKPLLKPEVGASETQAFVSDGSGVKAVSLDPASTAGITEDNFKITQQFSRNPVTVGASFEAQVVFENTSGENHQGLYVEFFFMLENSQLLFSPPNCREQLSLSQQKVLYCELGDFAPGQSKIVNYNLLTSEQSQPFVLSTAVMGGLRLDSYVNVVNDVVQDTDLDGISDFNESILGTDPANANSVNNSKTIIDVMTLYTQGADSLYAGGAETRINQLISVANQIYSDSGVNITLRPVYHGLVSYNDTADMDTALDALITKSDPAFASVNRLREQYGADLVILFRPLEPDASRCGLATLGGFNTNGDFSAANDRESAYSHIAIDCPVDLVVAHELGHNMGLTHSFIEDGQGGTFDYSTGYGVDQQFVTVMATPSAFNTANRVARFSDPSAECFGFQCGVSVGEEFGADAVKTLNIVRHQIAAYSTTKVADLPRVQVSALSGDATNAQFYAAATTDQGLTFTSSIRAGQTFSVLAELAVDSRHLAEFGSVYGLISIPDRGFFQINANGELEAWDGTVTGLSDVAGVRRFQGKESLEIINEFSFDDSLINKTVALYFAYHVPVFFNEIIYTSEPLILEILPAQ